MELPRLIQGGMGVGVSGWVLAREVSRLGQLGVVSGTALDTILVRRLGIGDPGGHVRRAMAAFPVPSVATRVLNRYFREGGAASNADADVAPCEGACGDEDGGDRNARGAGEKGGRFTLISLPGLRATPERLWLTVLANFVEVYLSKEGHAGCVGINYLHKIQFPTLPSLYGAMLAGVDVVLMGAGIPGDIPPAIERLSKNLEATLTVDVLDERPVTPGIDAPEVEKPTLRFDPALLWRAETNAPLPMLTRPRFLAIVSSVTLAKALLKKANAVLADTVEGKKGRGGGIDGFVVEAPTAGGHNAPPRGAPQFSARGEPIYGPRDEVDFAQMAALGVPFWLAGGYGSHAQFEAALAAGATGVQIGTAFAFCEESGLDPALRDRFLAELLAGETWKEGRNGGVFTDPAASPTGFPFKVAALAGTLSEESVVASRHRVCDLGYLRRAYRTPDGGIGYRCPAEPIADYVKKGGSEDETHGRKCLCNSLMANIGLGQTRAGGVVEPALLTAGDDVACVRRFITKERPRYQARDVVAAVVGGS